MMESISKGKWKKSPNISVVDIFRRFEYISGILNLLFFNDPLEEEDINRLNLFCFPSDWKAKYEMNHDYRQNDLLQITTYMEGFEKIAKMKENNRN